MQIWACFWFYEMGTCPDLWRWKLRTLPCSLCYEIRIWLSFWRHDMEIRPNFWCKIETRSYCTFGVENVSLDFLLKFGCFSNIFVQLYIFLGSTISKFYVPL
jgi:hypothetical protein